MGEVVDLLPHDRAVLAALATLDVPVGFAEAPDGALEALLDDTDPPGPDYLILDPLRSTRRGGLLNPHEDVELVYQVRVIAKLAAGARYLVPLVETALKAVAIPGRRIVRFVPDDTGDVRRDDDVTPHAFIATPRYRFWTTPAS